MPLFQKSVQTKYLNDLDAVVLDANYAKLKSYFGNPKIQEAFLRELFVKILGCTLNP